MDERADTTLTLLSPLEVSDRVDPLAADLDIDPSVAAKGIALLRGGDSIFTPWVCFGLLAKSEVYEDIGPAIEQLREEVKRYGGQRR